MARTTTPVGAIAGEMEDDPQGKAAGFVEGIEMLVDPLNRPFWSILAASWIDQNEIEDLETWWGKGLRELNDPELGDKYKDVKLNVRGAEVDPADLPYFMYKVNNYLLLAQSVDGRQKQQVVDMHTGWNSMWLEQNRDGRTPRNQPSSGTGAHKMQGAPTPGGSPYNE